MTKLSALILTLLVLASACSVPKEQETPNTVKIKEHKVHALIAGPVSTRAHVPVYMLRIEKDGKFTLQQ